MTGPSVDAGGLRWVPGPVVLDGVELAVEPGSLCVLLGPNGGGKTTTLRCLARLLVPDAGAVRIDGADVRSLAPRELGRVRAVVAQDQPAELDFTVLDVVLVGRTPHKGRFDRDGEDDLRVARSSVAAVGLEALEDRRLPTLSGGERQRAVVARAYAQDAPLLLLDEPTNHLDLRHQHTLLHQLRAAPATAVVTLHDPQLAATYADQVVVIDRGRVVAAGPPARVLTEDLLAGVWGVRARVRATDEGLRVDVLGVIEEPDRRADPGGA